MKELIEAAEKVYGCNPLEKRRKRENVWARFAIINELSKPQNLTLTNIGSVLNLDHSTVINAKKMHNQLINDKVYNYNFIRFQRALGYDVELPDLVVQIPAKNEIAVTKKQLLYDLIDRINEDDLDSVYVKLDAIVKMSRVKHKIK